ncbi:DUF397 domain-containing protein [Streptomyces sp. NPDC090052]|uniref:DUF397 domain-containing protein n=2 Tax=Streptomyces TaxID=1883 RepID=UPI0038204E60|nr:DUF397 domain-containing protein [Streptomyces sp. NBC_01020]WSX69579.1 DUF397 domain-containing protein [Streptomyces sp. NBC_00932]
MTMGPEPRWFKSTFSGGSGTECVECAPACDGTLVRDSKQPNAARLAVGGAAWAGFIGAVRAGQFG